MYFVKGADQKEYGPVTLEQIRQWIAENRLNHYSLARKDDDVSWRPLAQFPEFADALPGAAPGVPPPPPAAPAPSTPSPSLAPGSFQPPGAPTPQGDSAAALAAVKPAAMGLIIFGAFCLVLVLISPFTKAAITDAMIQFLDKMPGFPPEVKNQFAAQRNAGFGIGDIIGMVFGLAITGLIIAGGVKMLKMQAWGLALTAAILAVLPCNSCCCIGLIPGIWSLIVLSKYKSYFS